MLVPYSALETLPTETLNNLIKEYLLTQIDDGSFSQASEEGLSQAINQCKQELKSGELLVEFSEDDESFTLKRIQEVNI